MTIVATSAVIYENVEIGKNCVIEDFSIIGCPPRGHRAGELKTVIGDNSVIRSHTVIYAGNVIGRDFQTGNKVNIRENNNIGEQVSIGTLTVIEHHVSIGQGVRIHSQAFIPEYSILEEGVWIGPNVVITNSRYPHSDTAKENLEGVRIEHGAKIGANATLLPGVIIGPFALVGAGAVVTRDVAGKTVVVGNPAKKINSLDQLPY